MRHIRKSMAAAAASFFIVSTALHPCGFISHTLPVMVFAASSEENKNTIYNILVGTYGYSTAAACAIMGNMEAESSYTPGEDTGDGGTSYGLCQWHAGRKNALMSWCSENGFNYASIEGQLAYLDHELSTSYQSVKNSLNTANNENTEDAAYQAAYDFCVGFEKPAAGATAGVRRGETARRLFQEYSGNGETTRAGASTAQTNASLNTDSTTTVQDKTNTETELSGLVEENGKTFCYKDGQKVSGLVTIGEDKYFFDPDTKEMQTGRILIDNIRYYFGDDGRAVTGWVITDGNKYYADTNGRILTNRWIQDMGKWYHLGSSGAVEKGAITVDGKKFYTDESGAMQTGFQTVGGKWYYFGENGVMKTGWLQADGNWYYLDKTSGQMKTGWLDEDGKKYYLDTRTGTLQTGWVRDGGDWYYIDKETKTMKTGWVHLGGSWYYMDKTTGIRVTGISKIDGKIYNFDTSGRLQNAS